MLGGLTFPEIEILLRGVFLGVLVAAPFGPSAFLCMKRTLVGGPLLGVATGLGTATADAIYGAIAAFGITALVQWVTGYESEVRLVGGAILIALAYSMFRKPVPAFNLDSEESKTRKRDLLAALSSGFLVPATNPLMLLAVVPLVAALGAQTTHAGALLVTFGIFIGSWLWWCFLSGMTALFRRQVGVKTINVIARAMALLIGLCGLYALVSALSPNLLP